MDGAKEAIVQQQIANFRKLRRFQIVACAVVAFIATAPLYSNVWPARWIHGAEVELLLGVIAVAIVFFGAIICHELYEINDQLAGRSSELHDVLRLGSHGEPRRS